MPTQNAPTCMHPIEPSVSAPHATTPYGNLGIFCKHFFFVPFSCVFYFFFCENTSCLLLLLPPFCMSAVTAQPTSCAAEIVCENHSLKRASKLVHFLTGFIFPLNLRGSGSPGKKKRGIKKNKISSAGFSCGKEGERQKRYKNTNLIPHTSPGHTSSDLGDLGGQWKEILPHWTARP